MSPLPVVGGLILLLVAGLAGGCSSAAGRNWPDPDPFRPRVSLSYDVAEGHETVLGATTTTFVPDDEVCEIVLRAWPNKPATARAGNALVVDRVMVDGQLLDHEVRAAGAPEGAPGTLIEVALPSCRAAGSTLVVATTFTLTLGEGTDERIGRDSARRIAWLASAFPVVAWQRGQGWARDDAVDVVGEMSTTETFELSELRVTAPAGERVAGVGELVEVSPDADGRETHVFRALAMRDIAVTVGNLHLRRFRAAGTDVRLAVPVRTPVGRVDGWQEMVTSALEDLAELLGPVPYTQLWVSVLPAVSDGVEMSGAVQLGSVRRGPDDWLVAHELAHQWFYGLVGSNQARHPWLDESLATYAQETVRPVGWEVQVESDPLGSPMSFWAGQENGSHRYVDTVYITGGALLTRLRAAVGPEAFDGALRDYLRVNAHSVATPEDLRAALGHLPEVVEGLAEAGAWSS